MMGRELVERGRTRKDKRQSGKEETTEGQPHEGKHDDIRTRWVD